MRKHQHKNSKNHQTPAQKKPDTAEQPQLTALEHIYEVRNRLFWVVLVLVITSVIGLQMKDQVVAIVMAPLHGQKLVYLTPGGGFSFIFTISIYFGALFTIPVAVYQLFQFLRPLIGSTSKKFIAAFLTISTLLAVGGALFGYFVTIPAALNFLSTFAGDAVTPNLTAESYLSFVVTYIVGLALIFQLPLILFIVDHVHPLPPGTLNKMQNPVIIGSTVLAAVITPTPDAFNMAIVAIPIITVYEIGAMAVYIRRRGRNKQLKNAAQVAAQPVAAEDPLDAIIDELKKPFLHQPEPQPVPVPVEPSPVRPHTPGPKHVDFMKVAPKPVQQPVQVQAIQQQRPRPIDGFSAVPRQAPSRVIVPSRPAPTSREIIDAPAARRAPRSLDGFSLV